MLSSLLEGTVIILSSNSLIFSQAQSQVLEEVASEFSNIEFYKVNVDENQEAAGEFGIMSIPTLLIMKNGEVLEEKTGYQPKEALVELLSKF